MVWLVLVVSLICGSWFVVVMLICVLVVCRLVCVCSMFGCCVISVEGRLSGSVVGRVKLFSVNVGGGVLLGVCFISIVNRCCCCCSCIISGGSVVLSCVSCVVCVVMLSWLV